MKLAFYLVVVLLASTGALASDGHSFICADSGLKKLMIFSTDIPEVGRTTRLGEDPAGRACEASV